MLHQIRKMISMTNIFDYTNNIMWYLTLILPRFGYCNCSRCSKSRYYSASIQCW